MNAQTRQPISVSQAFGVLAFGYALVVALALVSDVPITSGFAVHLAVSQLMGLAGYSLFRGWYDTTAA